MPIMIGHRLMGTSLLFAGDFVESRAHLDRAFALYDPIEHRPLATRFGQDTAVTTFRLAVYGRMVRWLSRRRPEGRRSRSRGRAQDRPSGNVMVALTCAAWTYNLCRYYAGASSLLTELTILADEKGAAMWTAFRMLLQGWLFSMTHKAAEATEMITAGFAAQRSTGATSFIAPRSSDLARAYADLGRFEDAWRCIDDAMAAIETTKDKWWEAEVHRAAGEITLQWPERDATKAEACFERALAVARQQQAKSWELRAAMSMARLWRDQGKSQQAGELLAPVYHWFTEGFDTLDLKEAKALLDELPA